MLKDNEQWRDDFTSIDQPRGNALDDIPHPQRGPRQPLKLEARASLVDSLVGCSIIVIRGLNHGGQRFERAKSAYPVRRCKG